MKKSVNKAAAKSVSKPAAKSAHSGEVRIIGGQWKRTKLAVLDKPGLRPTPDRVRETLFNWLGQDLSGWRCVDAFAGTGALGFEAASRGAAQVLLVEQDPALVQQLKNTQIKLQAPAGHVAQVIQVVRGDGVSALKTQVPQSADLILLDPPFDADVLAAALKAAAHAVKPQGFVYLEAPKLWEDEALAEHGLGTYRHLKAGAVHAHLLRKIDI